MSAGFTDQAEHAKATRRTARRLPIVVDQAMGNEGDVGKVAHDSA
jgi:hypothetical protein